MTDVTVKKGVLGRFRRKHQEPQQISDQGERLNYLLSLEYPVDNEREELNRLKVANIEQNIRPFRGRPQGRRNFTGQIAAFLAANVVLKGCQVAQDKIEKDMLTPPDPPRTYCAPMPVQLHVKMPIGGVQDGQWVERTCPPPKPDKFALDK